MENRRRKLRSFVWDHFTPNEDFSEARCRVMQCDKIIKTVGGCTSGLAKHLSSQHSIRDETKLSLAPNQLSGTTKPEPLEMIAMMAALDGTPFFRIATSVPMKILMQAATNTSIPSSPCTIRDHIFKFYESIKLIYDNQFMKMKHAGQKFTLSLDEWTSGANRRYLNINVHNGKDFWCLGLSPISGSFTSEACLDTVIEKLRDFGLNLEDIYAVVTDGASTMKRFGYLSNKHHQLCLAHGIHLAIIDVLYKKPAPSDLNTTQAEDLFPTFNENVEIEDDNNSPFEEDQNEIEYVGGIDEIIVKVRKIVKMFRVSPKKTEILEKYALAEGKSGIKLILDTKTRWNSMVDMLKRFGDLQKPVQKALVDLNLRESIFLTDGELKKIDELVQVLDPVKAVVEALCRRNATLILADASLKFMFDQLNENGSNFAIQLLHALRSRIQERRTTHSDILGYLNYGCEDFPGHEEGYFSKIPRHVLTSTIKNIFDSGAENIVSIHSVDETQDTNVSQSLLEQENLSMQARLNFVINQAVNFKSSGPVVSNARDHNQALKKEMQIFETTGSKGKILKRVYDLLITIPPTSVEAERVFSSANNFCTKLRARLGDKTLHILVFLRYHFLKIHKPIRD